MSLINEALKRTRDASHQVPAPRPQHSTTYRSSAQAQPARSTVLRALMVTAVVALIVIFGVRVLTPLVSTHIASVHEASVSPSPPQVSAVVPVETSVVKAPESSAPEPEQVSADPAPAPNVVLPPPEPELPKLVLQGITSEGRLFEAMINDMTVREGDEIEGARVISIEQRRVQLKFGEHEIVLRLR